MAARKDSQESLNTLLTWGIHPESSTIFLDSHGDEPSEINAISASNFLRGLHYLASTKPSSPIEIILNNGGGEVDQGFAIYDAIKRLEQHVTITVCGAAYSMSAAILQAGDTRRMHRHSSLMIHDGTADTPGHNRKSRKNWTEFNKLQDQWYEQVLYEKLIQKNPQFSKLQLTNWLAADTIFTADQALELGLVDEIV